MKFFFCLSHDLNKIRIKLFDVITSIKYAHNVSVFSIFSQTLSRWETWPRDNLSPGPHPVYSVQCTLYSVQCTVYSVQCTVYTVHCTLYSVP